LTGALALMLPRLIQRPSDFFIIILATGLIIPMLSFYGLSEQSRFALYCVIGCFTFINLFRLGASFKIKRIKQGGALFKVSSSLIILIVVFWIVAQGSLANFSLSFSDVYDLRDGAAGALMTGVGAYFPIWLSKVIGPTLIAYFYWRDSKSGILSVFLLHVFLFGMLKHKAMLFYPLLMLFTCYWLSRNPTSHYLLFAFCSVISASLVSFLVWDNVILSSFFVRRAFFSAAINTFEYYSFFSENVKTYWSNSSLTLGLMKYPYHFSPGELIGESRGTGSNANNSFLSTGYMHAGIVGLAIYSVTAALLFRLIDSLSIEGVPIWLHLAPFVVSIRALLLSTDLPTAILTHGVGLAILLAMAARSFGRRQTSHRVNTP
jgi:hypothetical protein